MRAVETTRNGELLVVLLAVAAFGERALRATSYPTCPYALRFCEQHPFARRLDRHRTLESQIKMWLDIYINERDRT